MSKKDLNTKVAVSRIVHDVDLAPTWNNKKMADSTVDRPVNVDEILAAAKESKISRTKSIQVEKEVEPTFDIGNLLINDLQPIKESEFK